MGARGGRWGECKWGGQIRAGAVEDRKEGVAVWGVEKGKEAGCGGWYLGLHGGGREGSGNGNIYADAEDDDDDKDDNDAGGMAIAMMTIIPMTMPMTMRMQQGYEYCCI